MKTRWYTLSIALAALILSACASLTPIQNTPSVPPAVSSTATPIVPVQTVTPGGPDQPVAVTPGTNPGSTNLPAYAPRPSDGSLTHGKVYINTYDLLQLETFPPQFIVRLGGTLADPCHFFRALVNPPDSKNLIQIDVYSVYDSNQFCTQVLVSFDESIALGPLPSGTYSVMVNEKQVGTVSMP